MAIYGGVSMMTGTVIVDRDVTIPKGSIMLEGFPDVGLVGVIAASYMIDTLKMKEVAVVESSEAPPVMVLHDGILTEPTRFYGGDGLIVLTSEMPVAPNLMHELAKMTSDWMVSKGVKSLVSISGFPAQNRLDIDEPKVYGVSNGSESAEQLKNAGIGLMQEGFVAGMYPLLLREAGKRGIPGVALLAESFANYPDPGAAAAALTSLGKLTKREIDVRPLLEKADEVRVKARDLMKQAQGNMQGMRKYTEASLPMMYR